MLTYVYSRMGKTQETREGIEKLAPDDFGALPRDGSWLLAITGQASVVRFLGDAERAATLYRLLAPYDGRNVVIGSSGVSTGWIGRSLGLLAAAMSKFDEAARHFEAAIERNARMKARPFLADSQCEYAAMLLERDAPGDRAKAAALLEAAMATARELGMRKLGQDAVGLAAGLRS